MVSMHELSELMTFATGVAVGAIFWATIGEWFVRRAARVLVSR